MPAAGRMNQKNSIYIESLDETFTFKEIESMDYSQFKLFTGFLDEKELTRLIFYVENSENDFGDFKKIRLDVLNGLL